MSDTLSRLRIPSDDDSEMVLIIGTDSALIQAFRQALTKAGKIVLTVDGFVHSGAFGDTVDTQTLARFAMLLTREAAKAGAELWCIHAEPQGEYHAFVNAHASIFRRHCRAGLGDRPIEDRIRGFYYSSIIRGFVPDDPPAPLVHEPEAPKPEDETDKGPQ